MPPPAAAAVVAIVAPPLLVEAVGIVDVEVGAEERIEGCPRLDVAGGVLSLVALVALVALGVVVVAALGLAVFRASVSLAPPWRGSETVAITLK